MGAVSAAVTVVLLMLLFSREERSGFNTCFHAWVLPAGLSRRQRPPGAGQPLPGAHLTQSPSGLTPEAPNPTQCRSSSGLT